MAEVEPTVEPTVEPVEPTVEQEPEPEPEPEPEKKKRAPQKRDDAPTRAPRVRRVAKPNIIREELPPPPPTEVNADFLMELGRNLRSLEKQSRQHRLSVLEIV